MGGAAGELLHVSIASELVTGWAFNIAGMVQSGVLLVAYYGLSLSAGLPLPPLPFRARLDTPTC